jgi:hypothetical protein
LLKHLAPAFAAALLAGIGIVMFWPDAE